MDGEVEPLHMPSSIGIDPHKEVVLGRRNSNHCIKVATLEITVENGFLLFFKGWVHASKEPAVLRLEVIVELAKVGSQVREVGIDERLIFVKVFSLDFLVHLETAGVPAPYIVFGVPK